MPVYHKSASCHQARWKNGSKEEVDIAGNLVRQSIGRKINRRQFSEFSSGAKGQIPADPTTGS
jgi:hypothetical protein